MAAESSEKSRLLEETLEATAVGVSDSKSEHNSKVQRVEWRPCTFRVRIAIFVGVLLVQLPLLAYYLSSSELHISGYTKTYQAMVLQRFFSSNDTLERTDSFTRSFAQGENMATVRTNPVLANDKMDGVINVSVMKVNASKGIGVLNETQRVSETSTAREQSHGNDGNPSNITNTVSRQTSTVKESTTQRATTHPAATTTVPVKEVKTEKDGAILPACPDEPPNLQGRLKITFDNPPQSFSSTAMDNPLVDKGGHGKPPYCVARHKVAVVIPFRDRKEHLQYFVEYMHPVLQRQQVDYQIFIINQFGKGKFNRAKLMNIGFLEASKIYPFECFAFHDVDLILEDDRSLYWCSDRPRHMSAGVDKFNYVLPYSSIFGGVTLISKEQMEDINGFSNLFWGWGGEDDDVYNRLAIKGHKIIRYPMNIARYKMISHKREKGNEANPKRFEMIRKTKQTFQTDGLNTIDYKVVNIDFQPTYTNITVDVKGPD